MKTVLILQHGQAELGVPNHDFECSLKKHGELETRAAGHEVRRLEIAFNLFVFAATRLTQQTNRQVARNVVYDDLVEKLDTLYLSGASASETPHQAG